MTQRILIRQLGTAVPVVATPTPVVVAPLVAAQTLQPVSGSGELAASYDSYSLRRYRDRVKIDKHALDQACEEHPELYREVAERHEMCVSMRDEAKDALARLDSKIAIELRGAGKMTQPEVYDKVITDPRHDLESKRYTELSQLAGQWKVLVASLEARSRMLGYLTQQFSSGYFTVSTASAAGHRQRMVDGAAGRAALNLARNANG